MKINEVVKSNVIESSRFKNWFKNSKVVDENGLPLVVYHGTVNGGFNEFEFPIVFSPMMSKQGPGFYFTDKKNASQYMKKTDGHSQITKKQLFAVYLSIQNPLELSSNSHKITKDQFHDIIAQGNREWFFTNWIPFELSNSEYSREELEKMNRNDLLNMYSEYIFKHSKMYGDEHLLSEMVRAFSGGQIITAMKKVLHNDGVIFSDYHGKIYVAWSTNQIKSAIENNGNFSPDSRKITESEI